ncbi:kinase-like domain-containing protein, partial [Lasiosphaeria ovina]
EIGEGSFGIVYEGVELPSQVLVAVEFINSKTRQLKNEFKVYKSLDGYYKNPIVAGFPRYYYFGLQGLYRILFVDLLGLSLEELFSRCSRRFTLKTVLMLAGPLISRMQMLHEKKLIFRDVKPGNLLVGQPGTETANMFHLVDFGIAKQYRDRETKEHIPFCVKKSLSGGTTRYISINALLGQEKSRRDDLEALGYSFMEFLGVRLPCQGLE